MGIVQPNLREAVANDQRQQLPQEDVGVVADEQQQQPGHQHSQPGQTEYLGQTAQAAHIFERLVAYGQTHLTADVTMDYFAVSLPTFLVFDEDLNERNRVHCHYMMALGYAGLGDAAHAAAHFDAVLVRDANHAGALLHRPLVA